MAIKRTNRRFRVILAFLAVGAGGAVFSAYAATTDWTWTTTAVLPAPSRGYHTATPVTLSGGGSGLLVVGGMTMDGTYQAITSSQLFLGPQKGWAPAPGPSLTVPRYAHTATWLPDKGKVLVAGGYQLVKVVIGGITYLLDKSITSCELLDPTQNQGTSNDDINLNEARTAHTATLLTTGPKAGRVLAAGGVRYDPTKYDPTKIWSEGYINILNTSELYADDVWTQTTGKMGQARELATATVLLTGTNKGKVLVIGGAMQGTTTLPQPYGTFPVYIGTSSCELYNPATDSWEPGPDLKHPRVMHTATLLSEDPKDANYGKILVAGGEDVLWDPNTNKLPTTVFKSYEIYDPAKPEAGWICPTDQDATKHMKAARAGHTATLLADGTVLAVSGKTGEIYDPAADTWSNTKYTLWYPRTAHTASRLANAEGWVLIVGGGPDQCEFFQPETPPELLPSGVFPPLRQLLPGN
jgi:hypothetical protein